MDYSLLLGIHYPARVPQKLSPDGEGSTPPPSGNGAGPISPPPEDVAGYRTLGDSENGHESAAGGSLPVAGAHAALARRVVAPSPSMSRIGMMTLSQNVDSFRESSGDGAGALAAGGSGHQRISDGGGEGERARNFELHSGAAELEARLAAIEARMVAMGFSEQRKKVSGVGPFCLVSHL